MEYKYEFEEWRDVISYEGLYQVSNLGRVKSLVDNHGNRREKILKPSMSRGYLHVKLCKNGIMTQLYVHRLVAEAFLSNSDNLPFINHKNEDKTDNRVCNLEFCTAKYNIRYGTGNERRSKTNIETQGVKYGKSVAQYALDGTLIGIYPSTHEAQRQTGYHNGYISLCCNGKRKTAYGYIWRYING